MSARETLRELARRRAHAESLFQGGAGGRDDNAAVWAHADDMYRESEAENQRLRDELRSEMMERSDAEREADRLRAECDALRHEVCQRIAERAGETFRKRALHDRYVTLRDGIEKLRDEFVRRSDEPMVSLLMQDLARRLTEMLEGDFQEQLDLARSKYRGALDELRDK